MTFEPPGEGPPEAFRGNGVEPPPPSQSDPSPPDPPEPPDGNSQTPPSTDFPDRRKLPRELEGASDGPRRWLLWVLGVAALFALAIGFTTTYPGSSRAFCGSCHTAESAATSHGQSIHADVACLACHGTTHGLLGGLVYVPTLIREAAQQVTRLPTAQGVLAPGACSECHIEIAASSELVAAGHPGPDAACDACHGQVAHPGTTAAVSRPGDPHPADYSFTHGRDAVAEPTACVDCHASDFCSACHVGATYPHPGDWTTMHGPESIGDRGASCTSCHAPSFCAGCHGTEIPHPENWVGLHFRSVETPQASACATCHSIRDCSVCHVKHSVHTEQRLYDWDIVP
ncbi:MAG: hypothetical protein P1T08_04395 [Acidimicrobiia bacterium]|nr:hypothetical protein [Acidimicrobiia bacterium]